MPEGTLYVSAAHCPSERFCLLAFHIGFCLHMTVVNITTVKTFNSLPSDRHCMYTLGMGEERKEKASAGRREIGGKKEIMKHRVLLLKHPFHILSIYAYLWTPLVENCIFLETSNHHHLWYISQALLCHFVKKPVWNEGEESGIVEKE